MNNYTLWMTGLSGAGKSTVAQGVKVLHPDIVLLDGDVLRKGMCSDLGFSIADREENMRRLIEICKLFNMNGKDVITAFISPFERYRLKAKEVIGSCHIVYCKCTLNECERRDAKGLYKKARAGEIKEFTGIDSPFEEPESPELILDTHRQSVNQSIADVLQFIAKITGEK